MSIWTQAWIWFAVFFGIVEGAAIISKAPGATLTSHILQVFAFKGKPKGWLLRRAGWFGFLGWLVYHVAIRTEW